MIAALIAGLTVLVAGHRLRPQPGGQRLRALVAETQVSAPAVRRLRPISAGRRRAERHDPSAIAAWCDRLARAVRSGDTLPAALRATAPPPSAARQVDTIILALDRGLPVERAVAAVEAADDLALALTVIRACSTTGGPAAEPLDRAATALRARSAELADGVTQSAQARMSAAVMTVLPLALLALLATTSEPVRGAIASPTGATVVLLGAALNLGGWRWMRHIIDGAAR